MQNDQLILVAVKGTYTQVVHGEASRQTITATKGVMIKSGNWKGWKLQIRTKAGYAALKILNPKIKTKKVENPYN